MATPKTLQLTFITEAGTKASISLTNPKNTLTTPAVVAAMDQIIAANIFDFVGGGLVSKYSAHVIDKQTQVLYGE